MADLYVDGEWVERAGWQASRDPLPGRRQRWSPRSTRPVRTTSTARSRPRAGRSTPAVADHAGPTRGPAAPGGRPAERDTDASPGWSPWTPASGCREPHRRRRRGTVFRHYAARRQGRGPRGGHRQPRGGQPGRARAGRRVRPDHALELPAAADVLEGRPVPGRGEHVRPEAERAHPAHRDPAGAAADEAGLPAGVEPGARRRPGAGAPLSTDRGSTWSPSPAGWPPAGHHAAPPPR